MKSQLLRANKRIACMIVLIVSISSPLVMLFSSGTHAKTGFPLDDAWIHLVYGRSIAENGYLAYNSGIPATGATSPLWAYLLGIAHLLTQKTVLILGLIKAFGIILHILLALGSMIVIEILCESIPAGLIGGTLIGASPVLAAASISGMEVTLAAALGLWGVASYLRRRILIAGILMGLAALSRPEFGIVITILMGDALYRLIKKEMPLRSIAPFAVPVTIAAGIFIGWNLIVDGHFFPATFYQKTNLGGGFSITTRILTGLKMISREAPLKEGMAWLGLLGFLSKPRASRRHGILVLSTGLVYLMSQVAIIVPLDPDAFYYIRYLLPAFALIWAPLVSGWTSGIRFILRSGKMGSIAARTTIAVILMTVALLPAVYHTIIGQDDWRTKIANDCRNINEVQVELGKAIDRAFAPDARIGTIDAGAVKYFGRRYTVDLMGLNTPDVRNGHFIDHPLDALVTIPAWVVFPKDHPLTIIGTRSTINYQITYQSRMNTQVITVAECEASFSITRALVVAKPIDIPLNCVSLGDISRLRQKLAQ